MLGSGEVSPRSTSLRRRVDCVIRFRSTLASCGMTRQVRAQALLRLHPRATGDGHGDRAAVASPPAATSGPLCRRRGAPALAPGRCHLLVLTGGAEGPGARRADPPRRRPGEGRRYSVASFPFQSTVCPEKLVADRPVPCRSLQCAWMGARQVTICREASAPVPTTGSSIFRCDPLFFPPSKNSIVFKN